MKASEGLCLECLTRAGREGCSSHPQGTEKESTPITGAGESTRRFLRKDWASRFAEQRHGKGM